MCLLESNSSKLSLHVSTFLLRIEKESEFLRGTKWTSLSSSFPLKIYCSFHFDSRVNDRDWMIHGFHLLFYWTRKNEHRKVDCSVLLACKSFKFRDSLWNHSFFFPFKPCIDFAMNERKFSTHVTTFWILVQSSSQSNSIPWIHSSRLLFAVFTQYTTLQSLLLRRNWGYSESRETLRIFSGTTINVSDTVYHL
jgi:hypothetical protein